MIRWSKEWCSNRDATKTINKAPNPNPNLLALVRNLRVVIVMHWFWSLYHWFLDPRIDFLPWWYSDCMWTTSTWPLPDASIYRCHFHRMKHVSLYYWQAELIHGELLAVMRDRAFDLQRQLLRSREDKINHSATAGIRTPMSKLQIFWKNLYPVTTVYVWYLCAMSLIGINRNYSTYGNIQSVPELRHVIDELFTHS